MPNKLTDVEITIKALKELLEVMLCEGDLQRVSTISHTIDLINRLQAENERLEKENEKIVMDCYAKDIVAESEIVRNAKAEAYKEFANKFKEIIYRRCRDNREKTLILNDLDNLLKEMVGENNAE